MWNKRKSSPNIQSRNNSKYNSGGSDSARLPTNIITSETTQVKGDNAVNTHMWVLQIVNANRIEVDGDLHLVYNFNCTLSILPTSLHTT